MTIQSCSKLYEGTKTLWGAKWLLAPILLTHNDTQGGICAAENIPLLGSSVNKGKEKGRGY
jgi:hypothetical protein